MENTMHENFGNIVTRANFQNLREDLRCTGTDLTSWARRLTRHVGELQRVLKVDVATPAYVGGADEVANYGKHGNATVLGLHIPKTIKSILIRILENAKRIPEAERGLRTNFLERDRDR